MTGEHAPRWYRDGKRVLRLAILMLPLIAGAGGAIAEPVRHAGELRGRHVAPPVESNGLGTAQTALSGNELTWLVSFFGLSEPATAVHIHGPARDGEDTDILYDVAANGIDTVMAGKATLTDSQRADLLAGRWYVNVHTATNPGGELRAQLLPFE